MAQSGTLELYRHGILLTDFEDLENKIVANLSANHKSGGCLFSKLFIVTEGIYSMDGTIINLPKLIDIKKKYQVIFAWYLLLN